MNMITEEEILLLQQLEHETRRMRMLQSTYFQARTQYNLTMAKASERKVDELLTKLSNMREKV